MVWTWSTTLVSFLPHPPSATQVSTTRSVASLATKGNSSRGEAPERRGYLRGRRGLVVLAECHHARRRGQHLFERLGGGGEMLEGRPLLRGKGRPRPGIPDRRSDGRRDAHCDGRQGAQSEGCIAGGSHRAIPIARADFEISTAGLNCRAGRPTRSQLRRRGPRARQRPEFALPRPIMITLPKERPAQPNDDVSHPYEKKHADGPGTSLVVRQRHRPRLHPAHARGGGGSYSRTWRGDHREGVIANGAGMEFLPRESGEKTSGPRTA